MAFSLEKFKTQEIVITEMHEDYANKYWGISLSESTPEDAKLIADYIDRGGAAAIMNRINSIQEQQQVFKLKESEDEDTSIES